GALFIEAAEQDDVEPRRFAKGLEVFLQDGIAAIARKILKIDCRFREENVESCFRLASARAPWGEQRVSARCIRDEIAWGACHWNTERISGARSAESCKPRPKIGPVEGHSFAPNVRAGRWQSARPLPAAVSVKRSGNKCDRQRAPIVAHAMRG